MRTPASIAGHPIHPMLVPVAVGGSVLYLVNAWMRHAHPDALQTPMVLSLVAVLLLLVSGWLGGKLVYEHGAGVDTRQ
jgi:uncharacterized membrane protein